MDVKQVLDNIAKDVAGIEGEVGKVWVQIQAVKQALSEVDGKSHPIMGGTVEVSCYGGWSYAVWDEEGTLKDSSFGYADRCAALEAGIHIAKSVLDTDP